MKKPPNDLEIVPVFAINPPIDRGGPVTLIVGIPTKAWTRMQNAMASTFDLRKAGLNIRIVMFGAPSHEVAYNTLTQHNARQGFTSDIRLNEDFGIQEKPEEPKT